MKMPRRNIQQQPLEPWILKSYENFNQIAAVLWYISQAQET